MINSETDSVYFGKVRINSTKLSNLLVENYGNDTLRLFITLEDSSFSVLRDSFYIVPNGADTLRISFTPTIEDTINSRLIMESNAFNNDSLSVALSGEGVIPHIFVSIDSLSFVATIFDTIVKELIIYNQGTDTLSILDIDNSLAQFTMLSDTTFDIQPHSNNAIFIRFVPSDTLEYSDTLIIFNDDPDNDSLNISLYGKGRKPFDINFLFKIINNWGAEQGEAEYNSLYDINDDGKINVEDAQMYIKNWFEAYVPY